ncbi:MULTISPECIES: OmpA family protein [Thiomicrorhabdus]|uniref:OmpA family protein n=1 Tax=Thiomicrorhabdus heinhorstiae TaxID=2748010 RepID=A0ABS0C1H4_9GAMM|nr:MULTISPECIES: OmpA family protein [Thiomicrorhabdus]MBF6058941.1 OmpA family protein [Thiomicrorhabdus heinhorstiae]
MMHLSQLKEIHKLSLVAAFILALPQTASAGFFDNVLDKVQQEVENRVDRKTDQAIDDTLDNAEDSITGNSQSEPQGSDNADAGNEPVSSPKVSWSKFDFVPGDTVIFEDGPSIDEENGEFPSRWDLKEGSVEIGEVDGANVIMFLQGGTIVPYLKNSKQDYLPDVFTLEFDAFFSPKYSGRYYVYFYDKKNQRYGNNKTLTIYVNSLNLGDSDKTYPGKKKGNWDQNGGWRHISIAFTKGKMKAYMDDTRLINIPHYEANPSGISIGGENTSNAQRFIKNIRIAKGGVKYYNRVLQDGKIIVNGIRFDVNKATLKPESSGPINKIYSLMKKHPELKFRVEGHTDSDGSEKNNMKLSQARSEAVMQRLISMGISADRLQAKGRGESKPLDNNATPEGKANNRRVEFIKL